MRLKLERAGVVVEHETTFRQEHADFYVNIPRTELEQTGVYKIWISEVFNYAVTNSSTKPRRLPTKEYPLTFTVVNSDTVDLNVILGGLVGAVLAACVALLLFYVRKRPQQAMKAC